MPSQQIASPPVLLYNMTVKCLLLSLALLLAFSLSEAHYGGYGGYGGGYPSYGGYGGGYPSYGGYGGYPSYGGGGYGGSSAQASASASSWGKK